MSVTVPLLTATQGLNVKTDPSRLSYDPKTGVTELAKAINVNVDERGGIVRSFGFKSLTSSSAHSLFKTSLGTILCVGGSGLCKVNADWSLSVLRSDILPGEEMHYVELAGTVYFSNGFQTGRYQQSGVSDWAESIYTGDRQATQLVFDVENVLPDSFTTNDVEKTRLVLTAPPAWKHLAYFNGRIYGASDKFLCYTEPQQYCWYAPAFNWRAFESTIRMIAPVDEGIFVGTDNAIYFMQGNGPLESSVVMVWSSRVIEGTDVQYRADKIGNGDVRGSCVIVSTRNGILMLSNPSGGLVSNLTENILQDIEGVSGCAAIVDGRYAVLIDP